jgi:hypothetical protein
MFFSYIPGWDCHGLPIEIKALEEVRKKVRKQAEFSRNFVWNLLGLNFFRRTKIGNPIRKKFDRKLGNTP